MRDLLNNPLNGSHDLPADHLILGTGLVIMPGHFQSGMAGGILDAVLADAELIHSGNAVEAKFMGRMIGDPTIFTIFPKVFVELVRGDGKLGVSAAVQNVFLMAVDLSQFLYHIHCFFWQGDGTPALAFPAFGAMFVKIGSFFVTILFLDYFVPDFHFSGFGIIIISGKSPCFPYARKIEAEAFVALRKMMDDGKII